MPVCRSSPLWPFPTTRTMSWWGGYDADYLYLADSLAAEGAPYNRKLSIEEFERVWKTKTLLPDNIYIVINEK